MTHRFKAHLQAGSNPTCSALAQAAFVPQGLTLGITDAKGHECAAIFEVDADPVPSHRIVTQDLARPLLLEPAQTTHRHGGSLPRLVPPLTAPPQPRPAVVVARMGGLLRP